MSSDSNSFNGVLLAAVERALVEVLGEKVTVALRFYLDLKTALTNADNFITLMSSLVNPERAQMLRQRILQDLHGKFGLAYKPSGAKFSVEIAELRSKVAH